MYDHGLKLGPKKSKNLLSPILGQKFLLVVKFITYFIRTLIGIFEL